MIKFGTDGIRAKIGKDFGEREYYNCGLAFKDKQILIAQDTRESGDKLKNALILGCVSRGCDVLDGGTLPTPALAFLTKHLNLNFGIMVTASHNNSKYNGLKFFNSKGEKINRAQELKIEKHINLNVKFAIKKGCIAEFNDKNLYLDYLCSCVKNKLNRTVVLDCANGAMSEFAPEVFSRLGARVISLNHTPNGRNINLRCGSTNISQLRRAVVSLKADLGFAFDGDGDRVIAVNRTGEVFDGDKILYILATQMEVNNYVVGTKLTNGAMDRALASHGIHLLRANVGDKCVSSLMKRYGVILGGEPSGHIILSNLFPTGDGLLTAIMLTSICVSKNSDLSDFIDFKPYYQMQNDIDITKQDPNITSIKRQINHLKKEFRNSGRIIVRKSGTEPYLRLLVESKDKNLAKRVLNMLRNYIIERNDI